MKLKKYLEVTVLSAVFCLGAAFSALAGSWQLDENGWWWRYGDGSYPTDCWQWLDGNQDGIAECYYFDENGYLLTNTEIPRWDSGSITVNADGAITKDGVVQTEDISDLPSSYRAFGIFRNDNAEFKIFPGIYKPDYFGTTIRFDAVGIAGPYFESAHIFGQFGEYHEEDDSYLLNYDDTELTYKLVYNEANDTLEVSLYSGTEAGYAYHEGFPGFCGVYHKVCDY